MNRSYKYRLYPSEKDKQELEKHLKYAAGRNE
ncbi:helix-turn-helix domain-containing protein [Methanonatronarchaeum sp. AMET6-2]|nr:MAG: hypothetical protein EF811_00655 [Methanonatronarchaeia archaeon]